VISYLDEGLFEDAKNSKSFESTLEASSMRM